jgi:hypothetical protein
VDADVEWGWSVSQLAEWLCRIVVGEVVREKESKAREKRVGGTRLRVKRLDAQTWHGQLSSISSSRHCSAYSGMSASAWLAVSDGV